jgi:hypothetical protein
MLNFPTQTVTPEMAKHFLATVSNNRKVSRHVVQKYAKAIERGEWRSTGQPIIFDTEGRMIDGQHRCHAIASAGIPIELLVIRGAPADSFAVIDSGKRRNASDALSIKGFKNVHVLAAAAKTIDFLVNGSGAASGDMTNARTLDIIERYPTIHRWVDLHSGKGKRIFPSSMPGVLTIAALRHGDTFISEFANMCYVGANLSETNPAFHLRTRFINQNRGQRIEYRLAIAYFIKAINAYVLNKPMAILRMLDKEEFPTLL